MITVMGATGRTGKHIVQQLLRSDEKVRALGRTTHKLSEAWNAGAEVLAGEPTDVEYLTNAFRGADAVYTLLPYTPQVTSYYSQQERQGEAIVQAVRDSGVRNVVYLSSVGADQHSGTGPVASMHAQEVRLRRIEGVNVLILRVGAFFENFYDTLALIKHEGYNCDAIAPDRPIPMIASRDIAAAAATALMTRDWNGTVVRELLGQRDLTYAEATRIIGERIGKPDLQYVQISYEDMKQVFMQAGFSEDLAPLYVDLARAINEHRVRPLEARSAANTTPTTFEDFANELAEVYRTL